MEIHSVIEEIRKREGRIMGNTSSFVSIGKQERFESIVSKVLVVLATMMALLFSAIPVQAATKEVPITSVSFPKTVTIKVGEKQTLSVSTKPSNTTYKTNIEWGYQPNGTFTCKSNGYGTYWKSASSETITGTKVGKGYLTTTVKLYDSKGKYIRKETISTTVNVVAASKPAAVPLRSVSLNKTTLAMNVGDSFKLIAIRNPSNATGNYTVGWESSNKAVATVSNGTVTAKKPGMTTIYAYMGGKVASCRVSVAAPLKSISLNKTSASLSVGQTQKLSVSINPSNTTANKTVTWSSSNSTIASVSNGTVTAKKAGTVTITARVGNKTATCKVTVKAKATTSTTSTKSSTTASSSTKTSTSAGTYRNVSDAYTYLNSFRTTRSNQWYWNSSNTAKVTTYGLGSLRKDSALENTAKIRAQEAWTQYYVNGKATHTRPNGSSCFTAYPAGISVRGENLAWGQSSSYMVIMDGTWGWAETNAKYSGQGHRRNMLDHQFTRVGIACYEKDGKTCWAMCLGS